MTTLREIHKKLKIKQTLDNYVRNTNKKYKHNLVADEILGEGLAKLIELNTQGKLGPVSYTHLDVYKRQK